ncbi:hypothetical protein acsn021_35690 [Anaerocolumna cellulosilytica]|uniref:Uncharacterized protein n=1 Tax=Anaerocolumna cellulosilytica TaxID=433286 RepID=A0A6S6R991_9FIRM|nr:hypothetical protein [Anaerocolumna cellulosilytica]MBB5195467.1 hypothetical protein [Anaerocolumna cellulosilytica]BCJ96000.1 hypothetical protein acsn021_35690 [Anaerocolumna cellulosilytica]
MRKMDEMELIINQKGIKWSWFFIVFSLVLWGGYNYVKSQETSLPLILFGLQFLVYFFVTSIEKIKVDDNSGKKQILLTLGLLFLFLVFGAILYVTNGH